MKMKEIINRRGVQMQSLTPAGSKVRSLADLVEKRNNSQSIRTSGIVVEQTATSIQEGLI
jgi:hypothetical protein